EVALAVGTYHCQWECLVHFIPNFRNVSGSESGRLTNAKFFSSGITLYPQWELVFISSGKLLWQWELITAKQLPTANEDKFPLRIQSDATAEELCVAAEVKE
nr:hypothetical protein [Tanacetum cinerariifolium]